MHIASHDLAQTLTALGWTSVVLSLVGALYACTAALFVRGFMRRPAAAIEAFPAVTLLKPLHGDEPGLVDNLESFCAQDYPGPLQIVFGVHGPGDPAIAAVEALRRRRPDTDIALVVDGRLHGANRKVSNLLNMAPHARHQVIVLSDSDIRVDPDYLRQVVGALAAPGVGVVSCVYAGEPSASVWSKLSALGLNHHFLPNAVLGVRLGLAEPCFGSTIAFDRQVLEEIGGLQAFSDHLADDYEIGREIRRLGYRLALPPIAVAHRCGEDSFDELLRHEIRWARTIRLIDPAGYAGSVITHPLPLALIGALCTDFAPEAVAAVALALAARLLLRGVVDKAIGQRASGWWLGPARDIFAFAVFVAAFFVRDVSWKGSSFRVAADGALIPVEEL